MVIWLIGLSGSGKTTVGRQLYKIWRAQEINTVLIDGDEIRHIFKHENKPNVYTVKGRRINAERIYEICRWLDNQKINIVCCILSIFYDLRDLNCNNFSKYFEVFLDAPLEILIERDMKNLYRPAIRGEIKNVVGIDIPFEKPVSADMTIDTSNSDADIYGIARNILKEAKAR